MVICENALSKCDLTRFSTNFRFENFSWMLPQATEDTVAAHMQLTGLKFDHTGLDINTNMAKSAVKRKKSIFKKWNKENMKNIWKAKKPDMKNYSAKEKSAIWQVFLIVYVLWLQLLFLVIWSFSCLICTSFLFGSIRYSLRHIICHSGTHCYGSIKNAVELKY